MGLLKPQPRVSQHHCNPIKHAIRSPSSSRAFLYHTHDSEKFVGQENPQNLFVSGPEISNFLEYAVSVCKYAVHVFIWNLPVPALVLHPHVIIDSAISSCSSHDSGTQVQPHSSACFTTSCHQLIQPYRVAARMILVPRCSHTALFVLHPHAIN